MQPFPGTVTPLASARWVRFFSPEALTLYAPESRIMTSHRGSTLTTTHFSRANQDFFLETTERRLLLEKVPLHRTR